MEKYIENLNNNKKLNNFNLIKTPGCTSYNDYHIIDEAEEFDALNINDITCNNSKNNNTNIKYNTITIKQLNDNYNNYNTEIGTTKINNILKNVKWPLKKLSENIIISKDYRKTAYKTSIELFSLRNRIKQSSKKLMIKSEGFLESQTHKSGENDSEMDSEISNTSIDVSTNCEKSKNKFNDLIARYYMGSAENISGNYDTYVTNCLKLISYFKKRDYFLKLKIIENIINDLNERYISNINKLGTLNNLINKNNLNCNMNNNENINKSAPSNPIIKNSSKSNINKVSKSSTFEFSENKLLLVLDLDETLIHSDLDLKYTAHDKYVEISDGSVIPLNVRPYVLEFLDFCYQYFDIVIYTASCSDYADPILDYIEEEGKVKYFKYRLYRENCIVYGNFYIKDLLIFDKPLEKTIIVDNNLFSFCHYLNNGVLVTSYYNENDDLDLLSLIEFFKATIINSADVRTEIASTFEFEKILLSLKNIK